MKITPAAPATKQEFIHLLDVAIGLADRLSAQLCAMDVVLQGTRGGSARPDNTKVNDDLP